MHLGCRPVQNIRGQRLVLREGRRGGGGEEGEVGRRRRRRDGRGEGGSPTDPSQGCTCLAPVGAVGT
eukprot:1731062-Pyramimonas_sp.AAC.1